MLQDVQRSWRITAPKVDKVGLLHIPHEGLEEAAANERLWANAHVALASPTSAIHFRVVKVPLDRMRRRYVRIDNCLPEDLRRRIRLATMFKGRVMGEVVEELIREYLEQRGTA